MPIVQLPILNASINGALTNGAYQNPYSIYATNDVWNGLVWVFPDNGNRTGLTGRFRVPIGYVDSANFIVEWTSTAIVGDTFWDIDYRVVTGLTDTTSMDQTGETQAVALGATAAPTTAHNRMLNDIDVLDTNFSAQATIEWSLFRNDVEVGDDMAAAGLLLDLFFEYSDE
ncbi:MAG: hypothetical protein COA47_10425 [Robiginitomaculum sp.]|nr:MAG: hypothetical protein COA47_10425 [Robiginitomaculum sp.]